MEAILELNFQPNFSESLRRLLLRHCQKFREKIDSADGQSPRSKLIEKLRQDIRQYADSPSLESLKLMVALHVMVDLVAQGWTLSVRDEAISLAYSNGLVSNELKERIRQSHLIERDAQLRQPSVVEFVRGMERRRLTPKGWHSIYSLMRDGQELAKTLRSIANIADENDRVSRLAGVISPYLQFVEIGEVCEHTGIPLKDIWRYFRYTWVNAHKTVPGRSMMILVRDAAAPNHPVMGIAALGSAVVQQTVRDSWIGWNGQAAIEQFIAKPTRKTINRLRAQLDGFIDDVYWKDLREDGLLDRRQLKKPTEDVIKRLRDETTAGMARHHQFPQKSLHKSAKSSSGQWEEKARSNLFRSKRCRVLATLLEVRRVFQQHFTEEINQAAIKAAFQTGPVRKSVGQLVRLMKAQRVGINMMDITVCGALQPYSALIGGKLVCLLLGSPEVVKHYAKRYGTQPSVIASCVKGAPVFKKPELLLLCTTSLYRTGSSQYNRIKVPAELIGGGPGDALEFQNLGYSEGFGSFHFSRETVELMNVLLARSKDGKRVNSIFGEGVNPLMRKIRDGLNLIGLESEKLLHHGHQRIVYGVPLAKNFRAVLLAIDKRPQYLIPQALGVEGTRKLAEFWCRRWLAMRIVQPEILGRVAQHNLTYPIQHGAQVPLETDDEFPLLTWTANAGG